MLTTERGNHRSYLKRGYIKYLEFGAALQNTQPTEQRGGRRQSNGIDGGAHIAPYVS